jgi:hypothetical protein
MFHALVVDYGALRSGSEAIRILILVLFDMRVRPALLVVANQNEWLKG